MTFFIRFPGFRLSCVAKSGRSTLLMQNLEYISLSFAMITKYYITNCVSISRRATNCFFSRLSLGAALALGLTISINLLERRWPPAILPLQLVLNLDRLYLKYI
jgi:hypothetical protein